MSEPIEYRAVLNVQAALQAITVVGGYHHTVVGVGVKLDPNVAVESLIHPDGTRPLVLIEVDAEKWAYHPSMRVKVTLPLRIHWVSDATPTADTSRMQTYFRACADVEQALAVDITRGGLASDTRIVKRTFDTAVEGSQVWALTEIEIGIHRTYGQPNG